MGIKKKKIKKLRLKKVRKKPQEILFKIKPLERTKRAKIKKPSKLVKPLVKKTKFIKAVKPKKHKSVKSIESPAYKARIKVIGIGGGGSSIVSEIAPKIKKASFVVVNTDHKALQTAAKEARHFQFGKNLTQGLGTGMNPELGEQAAENEKDKIKEILKETDFCILISCLGGGTGCGASPVFAKILKNLKILTLGIFTLPFEFEGGKRTQIAKDSLEKLRPNLNALVIIPNQKIFQIIDKNTPIIEAFSAVNKAIAESLEGLITLIYSSGLIRVDFAALKTILAGRGRLAYLNSAEAKGPNQIEELTKKVVSSPLIPYTIQGAKEVLFNIDGGLNLNMSQVEEIGKTVSISISPQARVAFGITQNKKEGIKITLLANGCQWERWADYNPPTTLLVLSRKGQGTSKKEKPGKELKEKPKKKARKKTEEKPKKVKIQVRENALEVQKAIPEEEKKILAQERKWEAPAFLRHKSTQEEEKD